MLLNASVSNQFIDFWDETQKALGIDTFIFNTKRFLFKLQLFTVKPHYNSTYTKILSHLKIGLEEAQIKITSSEEFKRHFEK
jgi:hypothetical protein